MALSATFTLSDAYRSCAQEARQRKPRVMVDRGPPHEETAREHQQHEAAAMIQDRIREVPELSFLWSSTPTGMAMLDANGFILAANPALTRFLGYTESELSGMHFSAITAGQDRDADTIAFQQLVDEKISEYSMHKLYRPKMGAPRPGRLLAVRTPFAHASGVVVYTSVLPIDAFEAAGVSPQEREQLVYTVVGEIIWKNWKVWLPILIAIGGVANAGRLIDMVTGK